MKLVFYDGYINGTDIDYHFDMWVEKNLSDYVSVYIDAGEGISDVLRDFDMYSSSSKNKKYIVLTNSPELLNHMKHIDDIYLATEEKKDLFIRPLQECCDKELRDCHDIRKLYLSGTFGFPTTH